MVTIQDIVNALTQLGIDRGDCVLVHSSFKSLGQTENGADTVIKGLQAAVGEEGSVVFPTLCQKDWEHVYDNWNLDAESDVGYLTNYFRKLPGAHRSNQASHSVAAIGHDAIYLTETHGETGRRYGIFGDTPFAADSPWEKMYHMDAKVIFVGVGIRKCTFRHYAEYCFMEEYLERAKKSRDYEALKAQVWHYDRWGQGGVWPHVDSEYVLARLEQEGKAYRVRCGEAVLLMVSSADFVNMAYGLLKKRDLQVFWNDPSMWDVPQTLKWLEEVDKL